MNTTTPPQTLAKGQALLIFQIGPVQGFIKEARKTLDLWAGSYLLSFLSTRAQAIIVREATEEALVYPSPKDNAALEWHLKVLARTPEALTQALLVPNSPNRFVAIFDSEEKAKDLAAQAAKAVSEAWSGIAKSVYEDISRRVGNAFPGWDAYWEDQVARFPLIEFLVHPMATAETLSQAMKNAEWKFAALKNGRTFGAWSEYDERAGVPKDHLDGRSEVLGGGDWKAFWEKLRSVPGDDFKGKQAYGAVTVIKRMFAKTYLKTLPGGNWRPFYDSIPDIAKSIDEEADEDATSIKYYAVMAMDGDDMGKWVAGDMTSTDPLLNPTSHNYHREISERLASYGHHCVPEIVAKAKGQVVYCGGDDVLLMTPAQTALTCAGALQEAFQEKIPGATASVGIAVGHVRSPMQDIIQAAREAESAAKMLDGKGGICLRILKRSSESVEFTCRWSVDLLHVWTEAAIESHQFTSRFCHRFMELLVPLLAVPTASTDQTWIVAFDADLKEVITLELTHCLKQHSVAKLEPLAANEQAKRWMGALCELAPKDFLHFWMARAFLNRIAEEATLKKQANPAVA